MKTYEHRQFGLEFLVQAERREPQPAANQVAVKFRAAALNYRDLAFAKGKYNANANLPAVPLSDGAGEVVALGVGVTRWKIGDRVSPIFRQGWIEGPISAEKASTALGGGQLEGVLKECGVFHEQGLVRIPEYLSYEEAATLPCAAVTAWNALVCVGKLKAGDTVLTLGTGGVSVFAIQFAKMHGVRVIATSSSDEKLDRVRQLGATDTINYKRMPNWDQEVLRLTNGEGVDHVVEVGGAGTLPKSVGSVRVDGVISLIGFLSGGGDLDLVPVIRKAIHLQGIPVGSRRMFEDMNHAIGMNHLKPVIDKTFAFADARQALEYMGTGSHFGKIVIKF